MSKGPAGPLVAGCGEAAVSLPVTRPTGLHKAAGVAGAGSANRPPHAASAHGACAGADRSVGGAPGPARPSGTTAAPGGARLQRPSRRSPGSIGRSLPFSSCSVIVRVPRQARCARLRRAEVSQARRGGTTTRSRGCQPGSGHRAGQDPSAGPRQCRPRTDGGGYLAGRFRTGAAAVPRRRGAFRGAASAGRRTRLHRIAAASARARVDAHQPGGHAAAAGAPAEALAELETVLAVEPQHLDAWGHRAAALAELGRHAEALACADRVLGVEPADAPAWLRRGDALERLRRYDEAGAAFGRLLALQPQHAEAWFRLAQLQQRQGRLAEALASLDQALSLAPAHAAAWAQRGSLLQGAGPPHRGGRSLPARHRARRRPRAEPLLPGRAGGRPDARPRRRWPTCRRCSTTMPTASTSTWSTCWATRRTASW